LLICPNEKKISVTVTPDGKSESEKKNKGGGKEEEKPFSSARG